MSCCPMSVNIKNVQLDNLHPFSKGHTFDVEIGLAYRPRGTQDCTLEWWEKMNRGYTDRTRAHPNTWLDMRKDPQVGDFKGWDRRGESTECPRDVMVVEHDEPAAEAKHGRRTLEFRIVVRKGADCTCPDDVLYQTAIQTLEPHPTARYEWKTQTFIHPNARDKRWKP
jgi:hypothetical protein